MTTSSPPTPAATPRRPSPRRALLVGTGVATVALLAAVAAAVVTVRLGRGASTAVVPPDIIDVGQLIPDDQPSSPVPEDRTGHPVPAEEFETLDGEPASLADYRGRPLVVNFFASWCVPCIAEMPGFEQVHQRLGDRVAFLGLNYNEPPAAGEALVERTGVTYDIGRDADGSLFAAFGAVGMPTTAFVSPDGRIVDVVTGELGPADLERRIAEAFE